MTPSENELYESIIQSIRRSEADHPQYRRTAEEEERFLIESLEDMKRYDAVQDYDREKAFKARYRAAAAMEYPPRSTARIEIDLYDFLNSIELEPCPHCHAPSRWGTVCLMCGVKS